MVERKWCFGTGNYRSFTLIYVVFRIENKPKI